jgi:hypothetical protein
MPPFPAPAYMQPDLEAAGIFTTSEEYDSSGNLTMPAINTCLSLRTTTPVTLLSALYIDDTLHEQMPRTITKEYVLSRLPVGCEEFVINELGYHYVT